MCELVHFMLHFLPSPVGGKFSLDLEEIANYGLPWCGLLLCLIPRGLTVSSLMTLWKLVPLEKQIFPWISSCSYIRKCKGFELLL